MSENTEAIFGLHAVAAALQKKNLPVDALWMLAGAANGKRLAGISEQANERGVTIIEKSRQELDQQSAGLQHQGVVLIRSKVKQWHEKDIEELLSSAEQPIFILVLDGVQDPHNLGACLRTADAAGVQLVVAPKDRAVGLTPVVCKVASGAAESIPFIQVTNLARTLRMLKEQGVWLVGADERGDKPLYEADMTGSMALVMGAEGRGLRRLTREHCDFVVSIPMHGQVSSLNVSVATGVCLYEMQRQRSLASK